jgi:dTDP-4-amino-4,6-dideoxygalactose transaminase
VNNIPPVDLKRQYQLIAQEANAAVLEVLNSGRYVGGAAVMEFEQQFADYIGTSECVACNSGTDALYLPLLLPRKLLFVPGQLLFLLILIPKLLISI